MKARLNSYLAILCITIAGAGAATLIIHVANSDAFALPGNSEAYEAAFGQRSRSAS